MTTEDAGAPRPLPDPPAEPAAVLPEAGSLEAADAVEAPDLASPPGAAAPVSPEAAAPAAVSPSPSPAAPSVADGLFHPLDPRHVRVQRITGFVGFAVLAFFLLVGLAIGLAVSPLWGWLKLVLGLVASAGIVGGLLGLAWRWPGVEHRHASYKVDDLGIEIRRGVYWRQRIHVPLSRVQHTDVSQGPLERANGLGTLVIYTAGTDHAKVELAGLSHETALAIRDHLLSRSGGGDAV